jgi:DNA-directed RNA polymerase subunit RPC12/RpoP
MSDFEPTTDLPERIDDDDAPVVSTSRLRDERVQRRRQRILAGAMLLALVVFLAADYSVIRTVIAVAVMYVLFRIGFAVVGSFARPVPAPPPPGELRKVKLSYRCNECGTELRITLANDEVPEAPRHCTEEMELTATIEDAL